MGQDADGAPPTGLGLDDARTDVQAELAHGHVGEHVRVQLPCPCDLDPGAVGAAVAVVDRLCPVDGIRLSWYVILLFRHFHHQAVAGLLPLYPLVVGIGDQVFQAVFAFMLPGEVGFPQLGPRDVADVLVAYAGRVPWPVNGTQVEGAPVRGVVGQDADAELDLLDIGFPGTRHGAVKQRLPVRVDVDDGAAVAIVFGILPFHFRIRQPSQETFVIRKESWYNKYRKSPTGLTTNMIAYMGEEKHISMETLNCDIFRDF